MAVTTGRFCWRPLANADLPQSLNTTPNQRFVLGEEEMADVSLRAPHEPPCGTKRTGRLGMGTPGHWGTTRCPLSEMFQSTLVPVLVRDFTEVVVLELEVLEVEVFASPLRTFPHGSTDVLASACGIFFCDSLENFSLSSSSAFCCGVLSSNCCINFNSG